MPGSCEARLRSFYERQREGFWWPGIVADVERSIDSSYTHFVCNGSYLLTGHVCTEPVQRTVNPTWLLSVIDSTNSWIRLRLRECMIAWA